MNLGSTKEEWIEFFAIISKEEEQKLLKDFQGPVLDYDKNATFIDLFKKQVEKTPANIAVVDEKSSLTYEQTDIYTDRIAKELVRLGVTPNTFVGIMLPRRKEFMVSVIGTLKAGGAYVPLDNEYPQARIEYMLEDSEAKVLITEKGIYEQKGMHAENVLFIDEFDFITDRNQDITLKAPAIEDLVYMIYTSGSTGKPKGVMIRHKSLTAFLAWRSRDYQLTEKDNLCCHSSFSFDASVYDLFVPLVLGGQLHIISEEMRQNLHGLNQYLKENHITDSTFSTQFGMELLNQFEVPMKSVSFGGEKLKAVKKTNTILVNAYGPTEFTIVSNYHVVDQEKDSDNIPIGKPVPNSWSYVVDANNNLMPIGVEGELCLAGVQIALGYWKREDLTKEKFVDNPFTTCNENAKMYRTGDLVRWNENGELEYVGRIDNQIKLRGFRIELGEIESAMAKFAGIAASVAEIKEIGKVQHLCGYFTANIEIDISQLKEYLSQSLTEYMVPTIFMQLDKIPLTPNGKVDKKALPDPVIERQELVTPQNEIQQQIFDLVANMLRTEDFGITDDLFSIGMTSILAIKLSVAIYKQFNINIKTSEIFKNKTIEKLAVIIKNTEQEGVVETLAKREYYPLTENQLGLYYEWEKDREALQYNIPEVIKFSHKVEPKQLQAAVLQVIEAHPYLKTYLGTMGGQIVQLRKDEDPVYIELKQVSQSEIQNIKAGFAKPFDLFVGPLYRMVIYGTEKYTYLFMDIHHIIIDGSALGVFIADLITAYKGEALTPESYTAFEYALEEEKQVGNEKYLVAETFFDSKLQDSMTELPKVAKGEGEGQSNIVIAHIHGQRIEKFCKENALTPSNLFLSALCTVLNRYTREEPIAITAASSGRSENKLSGIMGMFVKTLPIIVPIHPSEKVVDFVKAVQENMFETMENELYPFTKMAERHKIIPQIHYAYQGGMLGDFELAGQTVELEGLALNKAKFPLTIFVTPQKDSYEILMEYDDSFYTNDYIKTLSHAIAECANQMAENPLVLCQDISMVSNEQIKILESFNQTTTEDPSLCASIVEMFKQQVRRVPQHIAIVYEGKQYTYQELDEITDKLAKKLKTVGVGPEQAVGVLIDRSEYIVIYPLAILKAGGGYMPLDYSFPTDRLDFMIQDAGVQVILSEGNKVEEHLSQFGGRIIKTEDLATIEVDENITLPISAPHDMFIILYTSGSTGTPKGCILENHNLVNYCKWHQSYYGITENDRAAAYANFGFDAHMLDIYPYITCGASTYIVPSSIRMDFMAMNQYFEENQLSIVFMTTQLGRQFAEEFTNKSLRTLIVGGEKLLPTRKPDYHFYNGYGPTECTIFTTNYEINKDYDSAIIGRPLANYQLYVLDAQMQLLPIGVAGELCIGGDGVGRGYLNRADITNEKFIMWNGKRVYRTGDMVRWTDDGQIEYIGRMDGQVKLRGLRIELGEIESQMLSYEGIISCAVDVKEMAGTQHLCGYYTAETEVDVEALKTQLATKLTAFMIPTAFMQLDQLPLTSNGKVNKKALPAVEFKNDHEYVAPANELEEKLCTIFAETLKLGKVGSTDNFFDLGGTSLLVMKVVVKAMAIDMGMTYANVFTYQTPKQLAAFLHNKVAEVVITDVDAYDYEAIDQLLLNNILGEITETSMGDILLTGVTGFLGIHIMKEFLDNYSGKVYCIMRSQDGQSADTRLKVRLAYYFENDYHELFGKRIFTVEGDITQLESINVTVDTVINCAANVKHFAVGDELEQVNVAGVKNLVQYCLANNAMLIQVSTTSVAGTGDGTMKECKIKESQLYFGQGLDNKYAQTKFLAERYVLEAITKGLNAKIMRVGNLMPRNTDGEFQLNFKGNAFMNSLKAYKLLGKFPVTFMGEEAEFSPIDSTAKAILKLTQTNKEYAVFHPYNNHDIYMADIIYAMKEYGFPIDIVSEGEFEKCLQEKMQDDKMMSALTGLLAYQENNTGKPIYALGRTNEFTTEVLYRLNFKWPMTSEVYIQKVIEALDGLGFFDE